MGLTWISRRLSSHPSSSHASEADSTALEEVGRLSTETQRRNGFRQSTLPDHGDRILEDIQKGNYTCSICLDTITEGHTMEYSIWHCRECYNVYHFRCVKAWSEASSYNRTVRALLALPRWKCPSCFIDHPNPNATCWCGKHAFGLREVSGDRPNTCLNTCARVDVCSHGEAKSCLKPCHPGPCNIPCSSACDGRPLVLKLPNWKRRFWKRVREREQGSVRTLVSYFAILAIVYVSFSVLLSYHIQWWTKPFRYAGFSARYGCLENVLLFFCGNLILVGVATLLILLFRETANLLVSILNLNSVEVSWNRKIITKLCGGSVLAGFFVGIFALPYLGFAGGPGIAWNNQMKNSCNGFNTRINMDLTLSTPATKFNVHSLSPNISPYKLYLASQLKPVRVMRDDIIDSSKPFEYYQRLSFERNAQEAHPPQDIPGKEYFAVDVDIRNQIYRLIRLNDSDVANEFLAYGYKISPGHVPTFNPLSEELLSSGTFTKPTSTYKHMHIPALNFAIGNMYDFVDSCEQEPFIKVYKNWDSYGDETGKEAKRFLATLNEPWDTKKTAPQEHQLIMRTASFGHGRQLLDMCIAEELGESDGKVVSTGVYQDIFIPFAIMAASRGRAYETVSRSDNC